MISAAQGRHQPEARALGKTSFSVPVVGMGTWRVLDVDPEIEPQACAAVESALAAGAQLFDTSPMYGRAEHVLARALGAARPQTFVATKIWSASVEDGKQQFDRQMHLFGGKIELEQVHNLLAWREHLAWLERERDAGRVDLIGVTHYEAAAFDELCDVMLTNRIDVIQVPYNPLERQIEQRVLPLAAELGIGVIAMRPFAESLLLPGPGLGQLSSVFDGTWTEALIKWTLSDDRVHATIPASSRPENVTSNVGAGRPPWLEPDQRAIIGRLALDYTSS